MFQTRKRLLPLLIGALTLTACGSSDDKVEVSEPEITENLTLSALSVDNQHAYVPGEAIEITYTLHAENIDAQDVTVDFYIVHDESEDDSVEDTEESEVEGDHFLGTTTFTAVSTGDYDHHSLFTVPFDLSHEGDYWIMAVVDPDDEIMESDETDNHPHQDNEAHVEGDFPFAEISVELHPEHEFKLSNIEIDGDTVLLDAPNAHEGTGEEHADIIGHFDAIYHGAGVAKARFEAEVLIDGVFQPVKLWDADSHSYVDYQDIEFTYNGEEHYFGYDIYISDEQRAALYASYDADLYNYLVIRYDITDISETDANEHDPSNHFDVSYPLYFYEAAESVAEAEGQSLLAGDNAYSAGNAKSSGFKLSGSYAKTYGDKKKVAASADLHGLLELNTQDQGAIADAGGSFNFYVFNKKATVFKVAYTASAYLDASNTGYGSELILFGSKLIDEDHFVDEFSKTWERDWEEERTIVKSTFFVGPIPVTAKAGVEGSLGMDFTLTYNGRLNATGDLFTTTFDVFAEGGVEAGVASAGVTARFTIVDDLLRLDSWADLTLIEDNDIDPRIDYSFKLRNELEVIKGDFGLHAQTRSVKWCKKKKWGIKIKYPCGISKKDYYYWFYRTNGLFNKNWTIFEKNGSLNI